MISRDPFQPCVFCNSYYSDLYPVLVRILQSLPELLSRKSPVVELSVQRAAAVVTLLTHVTQTAGYTAELQAKLSR